MDSVQCKFGGDPLARATDDWYFQSDDDPNTDGKQPRLLMEYGKGSSRRLIIEFPSDSTSTSFTISQQTPSTNGDVGLLDDQLGLSEQMSETNCSSTTDLASSMTNHNSNSLEYVDEELYSYANTEIDVDKLPSGGQSGAAKLCSVRLRHLTKLLEEGANNLSQKDLIKNLQYSLGVLDSVSASDARYVKIKPTSIAKPRRRRANEEDDALNEVAPDAVPSEVREWLALTFTNSQAPKPRKMERPKLKSVAHAIRAGLMVERIYRQMTGNASVAKHLAQSPEVVAQLRDINIWEFDIWRLNSLTDGHSLKHIGYELLQRQSLIAKFKIDPTKLLSFLTALECGYSKFHNPYHNLIHGADVCQTVYSILHQSDFLRWLTDVEIYACIIAALIHDVEHTGSTNNFHIMTSSKLAILYNDNSVLENHHLASAFELLSQDDKNILGGLKKPEYREFRSLVIDMVLATDMSGHFNQLKQMKSSLSNPASIDKSKALCLILHGADISHPSKPWHIHKPWVDKLLEEFFKQGDREKELGLPCSPLCDRATTMVEKSQVGFIDFIVGPTMNILGDMLFKVINLSDDPKQDNNDNDLVKSQPERSWDIQIKANKKKWAELDEQLSNATPKSSDTNNNDAKKEITPAGNHGVNSSSFEDSKTREASSNHLPDHTGLTNHLPDHTGLTNQISKTTRFDLDLNPTSAGLSPSLSTILDTVTSGK